NLVWALCSLSPPYARRCRPPAAPRRFAAWSTAPPLHQRLSPSRQRREHVVPASDLREPVDRELQPLRDRYPCTDREVRDRHSIAGQPLPPSEGVVEHGCEPAKVLLTARDEGGVRRTQPEYRLGHLLEADHATGLGVPVRAL